ncbi:unnamed protein product, partial [Urochloa humidicola]
CVPQPALRHIQIPLSNHAAALQQDHQQDTHTTGPTPTTPLQDVAGPAPIMAPH